MDNGETEEDSNKNNIDYESCRLCGLQKFEMIFDKSNDPLKKPEYCPCTMKIMISHLHEQILGCQENDKNTKPKAALSPNNELFNSQQFKDYIIQHGQLIDSFTDFAVNNIKPPDEFKPVKTVNFVRIETVDELNAMLSDLLQCHEIAVNLEYYWIRSYLGFTWLLQISTTKINYYVNCLKLAAQLHILNQVFMNIHILKIIYKGKDSVLRMQKDFGIFVINMFDIDILDKSLKSSPETEYLEDHVFSFLDPKHTYLLLYIKTYLTNFLKQGKVEYLKKVCKECKKICKQVYSKPEWNDESVLQNLSSSKATSKATYQEIHIVEELLVWRDETAEKEDLSVNCILPDDKILKCAKEFLNYGYSETFNEFCYVELLKNKRVGLNINEMIQTAKKNSTKKVCIVDILKSKVAKGSQQFAQQQIETIEGPNNSQMIRKKINSKQKKVPPKSIINNKPKQLDISNTLKPQLHFQDEIDKKPDNLKLAIKKKPKKSVVPLNVHIERVPPKIIIINQSKQDILKILKPQLRFKDKIDNSSDVWKPDIKEKPNKIVLLDLQIVKHGSKLRYSHPYKAELDYFSIPHDQLVIQVPTPCHVIEDTPCPVIKTIKSLMLLVDELEDHNEIAVDLKYNKERSYFGYTSLLIISTRDADYIIDALILRSALHMLNKVFTNPKILKVFYNSAKKLLWLQKDFSLYVVNMFDVARTKMIYDKKLVSFTYLKCDICGIKFKKLFQVSLSSAEEDWRIRPLSYKVKNSLRYDTHFLLYIKDILSNELLHTGNMLKRYYDYCTNLCKNVYQKPSFSSNCYKNILSKNNIEDKYIGHVVRIKVLKELNKLRNMIAQQEDENPNYIMSEEVLLKLVDTLTNDHHKLLNLWDYEKKKLYASKVISVMNSAIDIEIWVESDDDYYYVYEAESDLQEMIHTHKISYGDDDSRLNRRLLTLGDFMPCDKTTTNNGLHTINSTRSKLYTEDDLSRSFILFKGDRWNETRNIGEWLKKWIGKSWSGKYELREISDTTLKITVESQKYKDIIWSKRNQIHYEEGAFIHHSLNYKDRQTQHTLSNIAKDLRSNGVQVKIRELALKIEDQWYEWKTDSLQEISEEEVRKRGIDTEL